MGPCHICEHVVFLWIAAGCGRRDAREPRVHRDHPLYGFVEQFDSQLASSLCASNPENDLQSYDKPR